MTTPEGWTVTHQIAHLRWTDQLLTAIAGGEPFDAVLKLAAAEPRRVRRRRTRAWGADPPAEQLQPLADGATAPPASRRGRRTARNAVVRPADEPDVDGDRPVHGDLGARP